MNQVDDSADETTGDEIVNQYLAKQAHRYGFLLFRLSTHMNVSEKTRLQHCLSALFPNAGDVDRLQNALYYGCNVGKAANLKELVEILGQWQLVQLIIMIVLFDLGRRMVLMHPSAVGGYHPLLWLTEGPFYAMEVQPSSTFTYGGTSIDTRGYALTVDKSIIPGLLVAGVDAGGFSSLGYAGCLPSLLLQGSGLLEKLDESWGLLEPRLPAADTQRRGTYEGATLIQYDDVSRWITCSTRGTLMDIKNVWLGMPSWVFLRS
ncbi:uncharacterized protein N7498_004510 [Penicillium cinerascens]|uniref:FAD-dependent oxidoreductase 2 FAD-binding domain-containing protein n=1 Tax=Penicillium cinerascens TaxID=70096 RepID=A0A9W9SZI2_9EURO|nr:uncharacterized protein N7498_004510 [Penicillium cinerascens]KAJ5203631.1 hypothetical protein N7498_004510 [Penicillium cinerascens]